MNLEEKLYSVLSDAFPEIYRQFNHNEKVVYPYGVFKTDLEFIDRFTDGVYLDIDLFDRNTNDQRLIESEYVIRSKMDAITLLDEHLLLRMQFLRSTDVSTNDDSIKRRKISYYIKVNRR